MRMTVITQRSTLLLNKSKALMCLCGIFKLNDIDIVNLPGLESTFGKFCHFKPASYRSGVNYAKSAECSHRYLMALPSSLLPLYHLLITIYRN